MTVTLVWLPSRSLAADVGPPPPGLDVEVWDGLADLPATAGEVAVYVVPYLLGPRALAPLPVLTSLRLVQTLTAGYEDVVGAVRDGVTLCNAPGVHDASTAELAVALLLASLRGVPDYVRAAESGRWQPGPRPALADRRVLVLGQGGVGRAVERRLAGFEVDVVRVARRARTGADGRVHGVDELPELLPAVDIVVLCVPLDDVTRGLVDAAFLRSMRDGALLVNVSRGPVVDTHALLAELSAGRLTAALDVTDPEPLPADHPLWSAPGVLVSPHVGGNTSAFPPRAARFVHEQLHRLAAGEPLAGVVKGSSTPLGRPTD